MEHTKGPWRIASYGTSILSEDAVIAEKPHDKIVSKSNWEANAPMLAASPDMYEALQYVTGALKALQMLGTDMQTFIDRAEQALSKAEGKEE